MYIWPWRVSFIAGFIYARNEFLSLSFEDFFAIYRQSNTMRVYFIYHIFILCQHTYKSLPTLLLIRISLAGSSSWISGQSGAVLARL